MPPHGAAVGRQLSSGPSTGAVRSRPAGAVPYEPTYVFPPTNPPTFFTL
jgi:hypothetical protein